MVKIACANEYWTNNAKSILESLRKGMRMAEWKVSPRGGGGGGWHLGIFWVGTCRRDSKLAPRSKKKT